MSLNRYQRHINLPGFGIAGQERLSAASVLVVGAGGLGVPVLQYLCAMGIGRLGIVDGDRVGLTNLQRQVLYTVDDIGQVKAERAAAHLQALNPEVRIDVFAEMLTAQNALIIAAGYDLLIDATDAFSARYLINDICVILGKPWVFGAVHQYEGQLSVFNYLGGPTYRCLFPQQPRADEIPDCELGGVLGVLPGIIGSRQALEAVKILTGIGKSLSGVVLMMDLLNDTEYRMRLKAVPANLRIAGLQQSYELYCDLVPEITPAGMAQFLVAEAPVIWDVREPDEYASGHLAGALSVPLATVADAVSGLDAARPLLVYCQKGQRSRTAVAQIQALRPELGVYSLQGGVNACPAELCGI